MKLEGGCYCGALRYESTGDPILRAQCHCNACQVFSGGGANYFILMPRDGFQYLQGEARQFSHPDIENARTRDFCGTCGTHILTRRPGKDDVVIKVGTLDDPTQFGTPQMAINTADIQPFHEIGDDVPQFERLPGQ
jgi:hypothetical protein